jgi:hypothetical protein
MVTSMTFYRSIFTIVLTASVFAVSARAATPLPARAEVTYQGTYEAFVARKQRRQQRVDLGKLLTNALTKTGERYEGAITLKLRLDGAAAYADTSGTGGLISNKASGLVRDGRCRLVTDDEMTVFEGTCAADRFIGRITATDRNRMSIDGTFEAMAVDIVDTAKRDAAAKALKAENDAETAKRRTLLDARRAALKKQCDAGKMTACVEMDTLE